MGTLKPISGNGMITPMKSAFVLDQLDSIRTHKNSIFAVMRGAAACVADRSKAVQPGRPQSSFFHLKQSFLHDSGNRSQASA